MILRRGIVVQGVKLHQLHRHDDVSVFGEFHGVGGQVSQHLPQPQRIGLDLIAMEGGEGRVGE